MAIGRFGTGLLVGFGVFCYAVYKGLTAKKKAAQRIEQIKPADGVFALASQVLEYQQKLIALSKEVIPIRAKILLGNRKEIVSALDKLNMDFNYLFAEYKEVLFKANDILEDNGKKTHTFYWEISINDSYVDIDPSFENGDFMTEVGGACDFMIEYTSTVTNATQGIFQGLTELAIK